MRLLLRRLCLTGAVLLAGCGGIRQGLAEEGYLQQQLYDYAYDVPLDSLWTGAKELTGRGEEATEQGVRTFSVPALNGEGDVPESYGLLLRGWESEGRSYVRVFRVRQGDPAPNLSDPAARAVELELRLLERFHPEDARRFQEGARLAGQRAR
ncbi:hypothetical protein [Pyxidicoccus sp. MSG2]|uniref:hypothetical protein n=1 Tax=Pyxidicoccus sp. MSG2 TaxID=2996790 RepID=UPI002271CA00|nr:hypothetical protein [Pyxidicoccus sp. MSG2]MCY1020420.1 hypothetical protein [Pyxidicoccus sp. MSG2]